MEEVAQLVLAGMPVVAAVQGELTAVVEVVGPGAAAGAAAVVQEDLVEAHLLYHHVLYLDAKWEKKSSI